MRLDTPPMLLKEIIADLYSAECQLVLALPRAAQRAMDPALSAALEQHLEETRTHVSRLEQAAELLDFSCGGALCLGMQGLLKECEQALGYGGDPELVDVAIIGAARKIEHYEMAAYVSARMLAEQLEFPDVAALLEQTLTEELEADRVLSTIASGQETVAIPAGHSGMHGVNRSRDTGRAPSGSFTPKASAAPQDRSSPR